MVGYSNGHVIVWEIIKQPKEAVHFEVTPKDVSPPKQTSSYCDVAFKPKEAWVMDTSESLGAGVAILAKESLEHNVNVRESVNLSAVAVIGTPSVSMEAASKPAPPSVVVGGLLVKEKFPITLEDNTTRTPFILVYSLAPNAIHLSPSDESKPPEESYTALGNTGTKQENQTFEEDAFTSYISESELMSDSISIFSDLNMSDSSAAGAFLEIPGVVMSGGAPGPAFLPASFIQKKKGTNSLPKKSTENTQTKPKEKGENTVSLLQHIPLPIAEEFPTCCFVKHLIPSADGKVLFTVLESYTKVQEVFEVEPEDRDSQAETTSTVNNTDELCGALIVYSIHADSYFVRVSKEKSCSRKITKKEELVVAACYIPPDAGEPLLATALRNGEVWLLKINDLTVTNVIKPRNEIKITALSYVSSK